VLYLQITLCSHRYCAKLPSDTFTHLTPKCRIEAVLSENDDISYQAVIRLPINSPIKYPIEVSESSVKFLQLNCIKQCLQCFDTVGWAAGRASGL